MPARGERRGARALGAALLGALLAFTDAACRPTTHIEKPLQKCVVYRHNENLPLDAAPFFDVYGEGQLPGTFVEMWLEKPLRFHAPLISVGSDEHLTQFPRCRPGADV